MVRLDLEPIIVTEKGDIETQLDDYDEAISKYYVFLDALPPKTARLVARENFLRLLPQRVRERLIEDY